MCKLTTKDYDEAVDQCERVLESDGNNWKAAFRLATALHSKDKNKNLRTILNYAKKAHTINPQDAKVKEFYNDVNK